MLNSFEHVVLPSIEDQSNDVVWTALKGAYEKDATVSCTHSDIRTKHLDRGSNGLEKAENHAEFDRLFIVLTESELNTNVTESFDYLHVSRLAPEVEKEVPLCRIPRVPICSITEIITLPPPALFTKKKKQDI
jgi:hypothetical protein